jgi:hypothetical protein
LASISSAIGIAVVGRRRRDTRTRRSTRLSKTGGSKGRGDATDATTIQPFLSKTVATMFHTLTPMTLYIDIITWTVSCCLFVCLFAG